MNKKSRIFTENGEEDIKEIEPKDEITEETLDTPVNSESTEVLLTFTKSKDKKRKKKKKSIGNKLVEGAVKDNLFETEKTLGDVIKTLHNDQMKTVSEISKLLGVEVSLIKFALEDE